MRLAPSASAGQDMLFDFLDATNLPNSSAGHMHKLAVHFEDKDHFTQKWTWSEKGQERTEVFHYTRQK